MTSFMNVSLQVILPLRHPTISPMGMPTVKKVIMMNMVQSGKKKDGTRMSMENGIRYVEHVFARIVIASFCGFI